MSNEAPPSPVGSDDTHILCLQPSSKQSLHTFHHNLSLCSIEVAIAPTPATVAGATAATAATVGGPAAAAVAAVAAVSSSGVLFTAAEGCSLPLSGNTEARCCACLWPLALNEHDRYLQAAAAAAAAQHVFPVMVGLESLLVGVTAHTRVFRRCE